MRRYETVAASGEVLQFGKPVAARLVEAEARAASKHVRVTEVVKGHRYSSLSQSQPGERYDIVKHKGAWSCTCPGFTFNGMCKHIGQVSRRAQREGWTFGEVARDVAPVAVETQPSSADAVIERCSECGQWYEVADDDLGVCVVCWQKNIDEAPF